MKSDGSEKSEKNTINPLEFDRLPALVEAPGYRKGTGEFTFTTVTPKKYEDYAKAFMERISAVGVFFFCPCGSIDQVEAMLNAAISQSKGISMPSPEPQVMECPPIAVGALAELLGGMTDRNVQLLEEKGTVVRVKGSRGQYDRDRTIAALWKAYKALETGETDAYNDERVRELRVKRQERETKLAERHMRLTNTDRLIQAGSAVEAEERNALLNMPKKLGPDMDMITGTEAEVKLNEWVKGHLKTYSSGETLLAIIRGMSGSGRPQPPRKQKAKQRKKRKGK